MLNAIKFPDMISSGGVTTNIIYDKQATGQNIALLLQSTKKTLLGDPYFGVNLRNLLFEKNNIVIRDLVVDDIFTNLNIYVPQLRVQRKDIEVISDGNVVKTNIKAQNIIDFDFETYTIELLRAEEL